LGSIGDIVGAEPELQARHRALQPLTETWTARTDVEFL
jgi:hypothetical protein